MGFPCGSAGKESVCNAGDMSSITGLGRSHEEGKGYPLQYSGLANSMNCIVHGVTKSWTRLSNLHFHFHIYIYVCVCMCVCMPCHFTLVQLFVTLWTVAFQASLPMGFCRQDY